MFFWLCSFSFVFFFRSRGSFRKEGFIVKFSEFWELVVGKVDRRRGGC